MKSRKIYIYIFWWRRGAGGGEGAEGGVAFENPVGCSMYEGRMETVKYISVNIEKLQECTSSAHSRSTVKERKK